MLIKAFGFKKALSTIYKFPAIVLMPTFSLWTIGSIRPSSCCKSQSETQIPLSRIQRKIQVSIVNTWINAAISAIFAILYVAFCTTFTYSSSKIFDIHFSGPNKGASPPVILIIWLFGTILT